MGISAEVDEPLVVAVVEHLSYIQKDNVCLCNVAG